MSQACGVNRKHEVVEPEACSFTPGASASRGMIRRGGWRTSISDHDARRPVAPVVTVMFFVFPNKRKRKPKRRQRSQRKVSQFCVRVSPPQSDRRCPRRSPSVSSFPTVAVFTLAWPCPLVVIPRQADRGSRREALSLSAR